MIESCGICGGDGQIQNSFGGSAKTCPACHGSGRRAEDTGFRDVTKTKPSHYKTQAEKAAPALRETGPSTHEGMMLAKEVEVAQLSNDTKTKLTREIAEYEGSHGKLTQTFTKKIRKQLRGPSS
jgi:RecJ-like exonuclease